MLKRGFDIVGSLMGLAVFIPVMIVIGLIIWFESKGGVFYRGARTGLRGKPFRIFKFRTMVQGAENLGGPSTALNDPRLLPIGGFLRKYKLDELPQLFNVLSGEMSVVGPRPQVEYYTSLYEGENKLILEVKPGLTDYASIQFINMDRTLGNERVDEKYKTEIEPVKNALRLKYAKNHSFWIDMKIILQTIVLLLKVPTVWNTNH